MATRVDGRGLGLDDGPYTESFRDLAMEFQRLARESQVEVVPFRDPSLPHFSALPTDHKAKIVTSLRNAVDIAHSTLNSGNSLADSRSLVWNALKFFGWTPPSDMFSRLTDEDLVEIYDLNHIQLFRNFRFFEFCSYTLEDIFCRPWQDLFSRDDETVTQRLLGVLQRLLESGSHETMATDVGYHRIRESKSVFRHMFDLDVKYLCLLYGSNHQPAAFVAIESAKFVSGLSAEERRKLLDEYYGADSGGPRLNLVT